MSRVAILGWGSLLWCRKNLRNEGAWKPDGPRLPIEFAKISGKGDQRYLSLVLQPDSSPIQTYWDKSLEPDIEGARKNLRQREGCKSGKCVNGMGSDGKPFTGLDFPKIDPNIVDKTIIQPIRDWLGSKRDEIDAVIWTDLRPRLEDETPTTLENCIAWLEHCRLSGEYATAKEYIQMAPKQTKTALRLQVTDRFGWYPIDIGF